MKIRTHNEAFTLIEGMVAVAIISLCALALITAASRCTLVARMCENFHAAVSVMDAGELEYPLIMTNEVFKNTVEAYEPLDNGFTFSREVDEIKDEEDMFIVRTKVSWSERGKQAFEQVETYIYTTNHP
jgi:prepilin-type N-terminal cleavage/methylation domain-containing protein